MNLATWLERAGREAADLPALRLGTKFVASYSQMASNAAGLAGALESDLGLERGDRVALVARNCPSYLEAMFATWWAGMSVVPINAKLHPAEIEWVLENSGAKALFVDEDAESALAPRNLAGVDVLVGMDGHHYRQMTRSPPASVTHREPGDLAWLFYTSGTTGRPKGAMLSHGNLIAMSLSYLSDIDPTQPRDSILHSAPMSHGSGLYSLPHVCRRAINVFPESRGFDENEVLALAESAGPVSMFTAPTMLQRLAAAESDISDGSFRTITWGGAPMPRGEIIKALDRFGPQLAQIYGQGESPMTITYLPKSTMADRLDPDWLRRLASAGVPQSLVEVRVVGQGGRELETGEMGEVTVRGATVMKGYWENPEATRATLKNGWLWTGDLGRFDSAGYLTLEGRSKDVIISGGTNIYPREVEAVLLSHPGVDEAAAIGRPDSEWGEVVVACVSGSASAEELDALCLDRIARFKRPKEYLFLDELPKNETGKTLKRELRDIDHGAAGTD